MDLGYANYFTLGIVGTGLSLILVRWIRSVRSGKCRCVCVVRKTVVITGATSGLGRACALELAKRNCALILGCRDLEKGKKLLEKINKDQIIAKLIHLDLCDLASIRKFRDCLCNEKIDVLINNAGVMTGHFRMVHTTKTEEDMTVNYLGHFYLTNLLLPNLRAQNSIDGNIVLKENQSDPARIIFISSSLCKRGQLNINNLDLSQDPYSPMQAYANSKLALCLFARELHKRLHDSSYGDHQTINVITMFTGGMVNTGLSRNIISGYSIILQPILRCLQWLFLKDPFDACHPIIHCAIGNELKDTSDELFANFKSLPWPDRVIDSMDMCTELWTRSSDILEIGE